MSRVFFARQIQYYTAKIAREQSQQMYLQQMLNNEQCTRSNEQRLMSFLNGLDQMVKYKDLVGSSMSASGSNGNIFNFGQYFNQICGSIGKNYFDNNGNYNAEAAYNDFMQTYTNGALSDIKCNDIQLQLENLKSQIQADQQELKSLKEGEKSAIENGASKYA